MGTQKPKRLDQRAPKHAIMEGRQHNVNRLGIEGMIPFDPTLKFSKSGMPYCVSRLSFNTVDDRLNVDLRIKNGTIPIIITGDRAKVFVKNIKKEDKVLIFGSLTNNTGSGEWNDIQIAVSEFHWLGNMTKYRDHTNPLAQLRTDKHKEIAEMERLLKQLNKE